MFKMVKNNKSIIWVVLGVIIGILIAFLIFNSINNSDSEPNNKCSENYFWTGSSCCYDSDSNQICDNEQDFFEYVLDCNGIYDMSPCVNLCISKCSEKGLRIAVSAVHGSDLASHPGPDGKFYCNCVKE